MPRSRPLGRLLALLVLALVASLLAVPAASADPGDGDLGSGPPPAWTTRSRATVSGTDGNDWSDVGDTWAWAKPAIDHVAKANDWMTDFGATTFKPAIVETRKLFARALVRAFAPTAEPDPNVTFGDLPQDDPFWPYAAIAVKKHWMTKVKGNFLPESGIKMVAAHRGLLWALGLRSTALGFEAMHFSDGTPVDTPPNVGALNLGLLLGLRCNHGSESACPGGGAEAQDVLPQTWLSRGEVAFSLWIAATASDYDIGKLARYADVDLGKWTETKEKVVEFGLQYVGYPYVYAGEWNTASPEGYCCGPQPIGGFDCTGLVWWILKGITTSWDNEPPRPYAGWNLVERSSRDMGSMTRWKIAWAKKQAGDILLFDGSGGPEIDHADVFVGNGFALDSSTSIAGVTLMYIGEGWYRENFKWARRIVRL
jgi:cell wall-associated NlpC family hydrolase